MAITNAVPLDGNNSLWQVSGLRGGSVVSYTLSLTDNDQQSTADERDSVATAVSHALTAARFESVAAMRLDVTSTLLV
jgi:hypothetical protein